MISYQVGRLAKRATERLTHCPYDPGGDRLGPFQHLVETRPGRIC
jgi:hypothetical protein